MESTLDIITDHSIQRGSLVYRIPVPQTYHEVDNLMDEADTTARCDFEMDPCLYAAWISLLQDRLGVRLHLEVPSLEELAAGAIEMVPAVWSQSLEGHISRSSC